MTPTPVDPTPDRDALTPSAPLDAHTHTPTPALDPLGADAASTLPPDTQTPFGVEADLADDAGAATSADAASAPAPAVSPRRATLGFLARHPAHWIGLGFGSGLSPKAPGTVGSLWGWAGFLVLNHWLTPWQWAAVIGVGLIVGWWACTLTAQHLGISDPGAVVWDEIIAVWIILWLLMPASFLWQLAAFGVFRYFDAAKPGPVRWADGLFKSAKGAPIGAAQGFGIMFDDLVAAGCTLLVLAAARHLVG